MCPCSLAALSREPRQTERSMQHKSKNAAHARAASDRCTRRAVLGSADAVCAIDTAEDASNAFLTVSARARHYRGYACGRKTKVNARLAGCLATRQYGAMKQHAGVYSSGARGR